jgi:hypothetical protein
VARTSLAASKQELYALLTTGGLPSGVTVAYDYEPAPGDVQKPGVVTIFTGGMTPTDYLLVLRIYMPTGASVKKAQEDLDTLIMTVDARMTSGFGPSNWTVEWLVELDALVASNTFEVGREDDAAWR